MRDKQASAADSRAERVALWRAMHVEIDPPPHVLEDEIGLKLAAPDEGWRIRPDMNPQWTHRIRASIVARARFVEDLITEKADQGVRQYVSPRHCRRFSAGPRCAGCSRSQATPAIGCCSPRSTPQGCV